MMRSIAALLLLASGTLHAQKDRKPGGQQTYPAHVLIIRHAEKPPDSSASFELAPAGAARAKALAEMFTASATRPNPFPKPDFIFAARDSKRSRRSRQTAAPLGEALGLPVDTMFADDKPRALAREILQHPKYEGKTVLIVWHQGSIPDLAKALGAKDAPVSWKDSVFDRVWEIAYDKSGNASFKNRPQRIGNRE